MRREDAEAALVRLADEAAMHRQLADTLLYAADQHRARAEHAAAQAAERTRLAEHADRAAEAISSAWEAEGDPLPGEPAAGDAPRGAHWEPFDPEARPPLPTVRITIDGGVRQVPDGPTSVHDLLRLAGREPGEWDLMHVGRHEAFSSGIVRVRKGDKYTTHRRNP